jgi:hypothetical protein
VAVVLRSNVPAHAQALITGQVAEPLVQ